MSASDSFVMETLLTLCLLLIGAKIGGEIAKSLKIAAVVGELMAGVLMALAMALAFNFHLIDYQFTGVNETVQVFAELGAVLLLFLVGLETRFADFRKSGGTATIVATGGVIVPFVLGYGLVIMWGYPHNEALLVGAALTATSIAITVKVLKDIGKFNTRESKVLVGAAVIDDVLGLIVLAIVLGLVKSGSVDVLAISQVALVSVGFWLGMTIFGVFVVARIIDYLCPRRECAVYQEIAHLDGTQHKGKHCVIKCHGPQEASIIALCFGFAYVAGMAGLAPILGAFAAGMSVAETKILPTIQEVTEKINFLMAPLFFVVIGTYVNLTGLTVNALIFAAVLITLAMLGKIIGCALPMYIMHRNMRESVIVGLGMMSRGEVGLIIAGIGATSGVFSQDVFSAVVLMVVVTTVVTPIAMSIAYKWFEKNPPRVKKHSDNNADT
jgi:Na+:H+ antiporter